MFRGYLLTVFLVIFISGTAIGQEVTKAHIYLFGGSQYKNVTVLDSQKEYIIILMNAKHEENRTKLRIPTSAIRKIKYLDPNKQSEAIAAFYERPEKGIYYVVEMGALVGKSNSNETNTPYLTTQGAIGYRFHSLFSAGLGVGLDTYGDFSTMPVFLDIRGSLLKSRIAPVYYLQTGYAKAWFTDDRITTWFERDIEASWNFSPGVGVRFGTGNADVIVTVGYNRQKVKISEFTEWETDTIERRKLNRFTLGFGVIF